VPSKRARVKRHYIPAAYIGRFSASASSRARDRPVWVRRRKPTKPFQRAASDLGYEINLYDYSYHADGTVRSIDDAWGYERELTAALDALAKESHDIDAALWSYVLIPFVAGLLMRGPDIGGENGAEEGRLLEFQELLAPFAAAKWTVLHFKSAPPLVTSDRGWSTAIAPYAGHVVPLDPRTLLVVEPTRRRTILRWTERGWRAPVVHRSPPGFEVDAWNATISAGAREQIFGPTETAVERAAEHLEDRRPSSPFADFVDQMDLGCHLYDYFRILSAISRTLPDAQEAIETVDWRAVDEERWTAPVWIELIMGSRTGGGVRVVAPDGIEVDLSLGVVTRFRRHQFGDFRTGARIPLPLAQIRDLPTEKQSGRASELTSLDRGGFVDFNLEHALQTPKRTSGSVR
jgi:hypothetical protein